MSSDISAIMKSAKQAAEEYVKGEVATPWYDHRYDWARGPENWMWYERGILGHHYIRKGDRVLDLCCGDGMFSGLVFSKKASLIHGIDRSSQVIALARELYARESVMFFESNVLKDDFPAPEYDTVVFFAAIEHFTREEIHYLLDKIVQVLAPGGILLGSTLLLGKSGNPEHAIEFESVKELEKLLTSHFKNVTTWTTVWNEYRTEVYFLCRKDR